MQNQWAKICFFALHVSSAVLGMATDGDSEHKGEILSMKIPLGFVAMRYFELIGAKNIPGLKELKNNGCFDPNYCLDDAVVLRCPVALAVSTRDKDVVNEVLNLGASLSPQAMHDAVARSSVDIARLLIERGANVNAEYKGHVPFHHARTEEMIRLLLDRGALIPPQDLHLHLAASSGDVVVARLLIDHSADVNAVYEGGEPLCKAKTKEMLLLLLGRGARVPSQVIHRAVEDDDVDVAQILFNHGADVNAQYYHRTPLYRAKSKKMIRLLLDRGAQINECCGFGETLLHKISYGDEDASLMRWLIDEVHADVNVRDKNGNIPLAKVFCDGTKLHILLSRGSDLCSRDNEGVAAVCKIFLRGSRIHAKRLKKYGFDLDGVVDSKGNTLLHKAAMAAEVGKCRELLRHGASPCVQNNDGWHVYEALLIGSNGDDDYVAFAKKLRDMRGPYKTKKSKKKKLPEFEDLIDFIIDEPESDFSDDESKISPLQPIISN